MNYIGIFAEKLPGMKNRNGAMRKTENSVSTPLRKSLYCEVVICTPGFLFQSELQKDKEKASVDYVFRFGQKNRLSGKQAR